MQIDADRWEPYGTIVGTIRNKLGTNTGTKMLARFGAQVATFRVAVEGVDAVHGLP